MIKNVRNLIFFYFFKGIEAEFNELTFITAEVFDNDFGKDVSECKLEFLRDRTSIAVRLRKHSHFIFIKVIE